MEKQKYIIRNSGEDSSTINIMLDKNEYALLNRVVDMLNDNAGTYAPSISIFQETPKQVKIKKIWTRAYRPFVMGGNTNEVICTYVHIFEERTINEFDFFSIRTPAGTVKICDAYTGGIIADSFEELERNIKGVKREILQEQLDRAKKAADDDATELTNDEFFRYYKY